MCCCHTSDACHDLRVTCPDIVPIPSSGHVLIRPFISANAEESNNANKTCLQSLATNLAIRSILVNYPIWPVNLRIIRCYDITINVSIFAAVLLWPVMTHGHPPVSPGRCDHCLCPHPPPRSTQSGIPGCQSWSDHCPGHTRVTRVRGWDRPAWRGLVTRDRHVLHQHQGGEQ